MPLASAYKVDPPLHTSPYPSQMYLSVHLFGGAKRHVSDPISRRAASDRPADRSNRFDHSRLQAVAFTGSATFACKCGAARTALAQATGGAGGFGVVISGGNGGNPGTPVALVLYPSALEERQAPLRAVTAAMAGPPQPLVVVAGPMA